MDSVEMIRDVARDSSRSNDEKFAHYDEKLDMHGVQIMCPPNDEAMLAYHLFIKFTSQQGPKAWQFRMEPASPLATDRRWLGKQRMRLDDTVVGTLNDTDSTDDVISTHAMLMDGEHILEVYGVRPLCGRQVSQSWRCCPLED
jgi:hypothetical protein